MELDPELPYESLADLVDFERNLGLQLWNLIKQIASYQNNFLDTLGYDVNSVPVLRFEQRFAVPLSAFAGGSEEEVTDTWASAVLPCSFCVGESGRWSFRPQAFENMSR